MRILLTGATGYLGGRLAPRLLERGHDVRVLVRDRSRLRDVPWADDVEVVEGDLSDPDSVRRAFEGREIAYFLVHSMTAHRDFAEVDRRHAETFAAGLYEYALPALRPALLPALSEPPPPL